MRLCVKFPTAARNRLVVKSVEGKTLVLFNIHVSNSRQGPVLKGAFAVSSDWGGVTPAQIATETSLPKHARKRSRECLYHEA